jgi:hypothetical protein
MRTIQADAWRMSTPLRVAARRPALRRLGRKASPMDGDSLSYSYNKLSSCMDALWKSESMRVKIACRTGLYISCIGLVALCSPRLVVAGIQYLTLTASDVSLDAVFVRLAGCLCLMFGGYYFGAALDEVDGRPPLYFYRATVAVRYLFCVACLVMFVLHGCKSLWIVGLGVMNAASARALSVHLHGLRLL